MAKNIKYYGVKELFPYKRKRSLKFLKYSVTHLSEKLITHISEKKKLITHISERKKLITHISERKKLITHISERKK
jgi:hypothetical protein